jgi:predicted GIY-YIG superfamily endonuclease
MRIYKATNIENGKVYIGQTTQPFEVRRAQHEYGHGAFYFGNALKKYDLWFKKHDATHYIDDKALRPEEFFDDTEF